MPAATVVRLLFGVVWAIDAVMKWLPGYRSSFVASLKGAAQGQPGFLHGWFQFWINLTEKAPNLFVDLTAVTETLIAAVLLLGVARRLGYAVGALYMLFVWAVGEGFGGPYTSGATDVGTGIIYTLFFVALLVLSPRAEADLFSLDRTLVRRWTWWHRLGEPVAVPAR